MSLKISDTGSSLVWGEEEEKENNRVGETVTPVFQNLKGVEKFFDYDEIRGALLDYVQDRLNKIDPRIDIPEDSETPDIEAFPLFEEGQGLFVELPEEEDSLISRVIPLPEDPEESERVIQELYSQTPSSSPSSDAAPLSSGTQADIKQTARTPHAAHQASAWDDKDMNGKGAQRQLQRVNSKSYHTFILMSQKELKELMKEIRNKENKIEKREDGLFQIFYGDNQKFVFSYHKNGNPTLIPWKGDRILPLSGKEASELLQGFKDGNKEGLSFSEFAKTFSRSG